MNYHNVLNRVFKEAKNIFWIGGTISFVVYGIVIWCFTKAPIPIIGALRESSILFSILIGFFFLKERITFIKILSILFIFAGVLLLKI